MSAYLGTPAVTYSWVTYPGVTYLFLQQLCTFRILEALVQFLVHLFLQFSQSLTDDVIASSKHDATLQYKRTPPRILDSNTTPLIAQDLCSDSFIS